MNKFIVTHFDDYHEIEDKGDYTACELGCFPVEEFGYCRYFGLFYQGRKPSVKDVVARVLKKVTLGEFRHGRTGEDIGSNKDEIIEKVTTAMKG